MKKSDVLRRVTLIILVASALLMTLSGISNISIGDLFTEVKEQVSSQMAKTKNLVDNDPSLAEKTSNQQQEENGHMLNDSLPENKTLEEAVNMEQYPKEKVIATGYTAGAESTGKTPDHPEYGITYSGVEVTRDLYSTIAADLSVFPIGTILYIPDYGYGVVADKGGLIKGNKIDLFYDTVDDVYSEWGIKELDVHVVEMGSGHLTEEMLSQLNENEALQVFREQIDK